MMEGITIIVLEEILMANGLTVLMMWFLLFCRRKNRESLHVGDKIYDGIAIVNLVGALSETIAFLVDGKQFTGSRQINYMRYCACCPTESSSALKADITSSEGELYARILLLTTSIFIRVRFVSPGRPNR